MKDKFLTMIILILLLQAVSTIEAQVASPKFPQVAESSNVPTVKDYAVIFDSLVTHLQVVAQDTNRWIGQPFSEVVKVFKENDVKIIRLGIYSRDKNEPSRQIKKTFRNFQLSVLVIIYAGSKMYPIAQPEPQNHCP